ncbi:MAG: TatD family hydrolase [Candidatus Firestonebacteria bacterium]
MKEVNKVRKAEKESKVKEEKIKVAVPFIIDTHAHLDDERYNFDRDEVIKRAKSSGIEYIINVGTDKESNEFSLKLTRKYDNIYATIGIHPHNVENTDDNIFNNIEELLSDEKVVAIGETGLDYFENISPRDEQERVFRKLINLAIKHSLPLIIHSRDAHNDVLKILKQERAVEIGGVYHCFSGDKNILQQVLNLGFYVGIGGTITFPNANNLRELIKDIPLYRLVLETDCPYLAPQSKRGSRNEPAYIVEIAEKIAQVLNLDVSTIYHWSEINSKCLFKIGIKEQGKIAYQIRDSLYLNITNRCSNQCTFCARNYSPVVKGYNLRLAREPSISEIINAVGDPKRFKEIVFCGYGESLIRLSTVMAVAKELKKKGGFIRIDTNGQANLIHSENIVPRLSGLVDAISISLNAGNEVEYQSWCQSQFGEKAYNSIKDFILECKKYIPTVIATVVTVPGLDIERCKHIVNDELHVALKIREHGKVG